MKIKFIGVPREDHDTIHMYGLDFPIDKYVDVQSLEAQRKLSNHPHFAVKPSDQPEDAKVIEDPTPTPEAPKPKAKPGPKPKAK